MYKRQIIVGVEILIDLFCGNAEMIFETGFWFLEEMRRVVLNWSWVLSPIFIFCFFQEENILRTPQLLIDKIIPKPDSKLARTRRIHASHVIRILISS